MNAQNKFIERLKNKINVRYPMPELEILKTGYPDLGKQFIAISKLVGGAALLLPEGEDINTLIRACYPEAATIASNLAYINLATVNPDTTADPHLLDNLDLSVIEGTIGVAENGCIWIPQQVRQKVIYFISDYLVIVLDRKNIVPTMHDAYQLISGKEYGFGVFISGPSKTADIEQALVVGAHGARGVTVVLR